MATIYTATAMKRVSEEEFWAAVDAADDDSRWSTGMADRAVYVTALLGSMDHVIAKKVTTYNRVPLLGIPKPTAADRVEYFVADVQA